MTTDQPAPHRILTICLDRRLPDLSEISKLPGDFDDYGRCAILSKGAFWFAGIYSSHPGTTMNGFYWAFSGETLFMSPRGSTYRWKEQLSNDFIRYVIRKIGLNKNFKYYTGCNPDF